MPETLKGRKLMSLDMGALIAGEDGASGAVVRQRQRHRERGHGGHLVMLVSDVLYWSVVRKKALDNLETWSISSLIVS